MTPKLIIGFTVAVLLASCSDLGQNEQRSVSPRAKEIRAALNHTVIPEIDLENVTPEEALRVWAEKSREYHPLHFKFQHVLSYPMTFSQGTLTTGATSGRSPKVTVRRKNITSKRLLDEICQEANLVWTITGRVIVIRPQTTTAGQQP
ncbi:MAG TPA: hypothetical protein VL171_09315 [Verrucomicrobiae bacterium]|nr:hypothetical protein [Verrucomicrobiae bacterium]